MLSRLDCVLLLRCLVLSGDLPVSLDVDHLAQFSLNNVHKRGLKHHHFIHFDVDHLAMISETDRNNMAQSAIPDILHSCSANCQTVVLVLQNAPSEPCGNIACL